MDEDLFLILSNPFPKDKRPLGFAREERRTDSLLKAKPHEKFTAFRASLATVLAPHIENAKAVQEIIFLDVKSPAYNISSGQAGREIGEKLGEIEKFFRTYIETAADELLESEAIRIEKRYFEKSGVQSQLEFLKLKRYYEKLKTFNTSASRLWKEINNTLKAVSITANMEKIAEAIYTDYIEPCQKLSRFTDFFLHDLGDYLKIETEGINQNTGNFVIEMKFDPIVRYSIQGFFGDTPYDFSDKIFQDESIFPEHLKKSSIAKNIVLETREHKLNRASIFSTLMHGSRDWNRSTWYYLELPAQEYEKSLEMFKKSYHVALTSETRSNPISSTSALLRTSIGDDFLEPYINMIYGKLQEISALLIAKDFPGLDNPYVFLYHCGPIAFLNILLYTLQHEHLGEIFYLKKDRTTERTYPDGIIKREIIEWWNETFSDMSGEDADSYILYTRALDMVKKDYRALYEEAINIRKRETGKGRVGLDLWLKENQRRIFGIRKFHIFKRFLGDAWIEL